MREMEGEAGKKTPQKRDGKSLIFMRWPSFKIICPNFLSEISM